LLGLVCLLVASKFQ
jgi:hypothetical protein